MQLTIEKKVETKEFVEVPNGFYKYATTYYMVTDSDCIEVTKPGMFTRGRVSILVPGYDNNSIAFTLKGEMISKDEFMSAYHEVHNAQVEILSPGLLKTA